MNELQQQRTLKYPNTWRKDSIDLYEMLHYLGIVTQTDIDAIEERLVWFRNVRDEYAQKRLNGTTKQ